MSNRTHSVPSGDVTAASRTPILVLAVLMLGDAVFIGLHLIYLQTSLLPSSRWSIEQDGGYAEIFQYMKFVGLCAVLGQLHLRSHSRLLLGWIAIFALLLLDDAGQIHERMGFALAARTRLPDIGTVRGNDFGELIYALLVGLLVLPIVAIGLMHRMRQIRVITADLSVLLLALGGCGVGADLLHQMLSATFMDVPAGMLEDGGEMLVLSVTCAYVIQWMNAAPRMDGSQLRFRPGKLLRR